MHVTFKCKIKIIIFEEYLNISLKSNLNKILIKKMFNKETIYERVNVLTSNKIEYFVVSSLSQNKIDHKNSQYEREYN